jgi:paraquat-inducible protein B
VVIDVDPDAVEGTASVKGKVAENLKALISAGLRARLNLQSLVTGQLLVELEMLPDQEARLSGAEQPYPEIPTVPSTFERIAKTLQELPIAEILDKLSVTLTAVEKFVKNPALTQSVDNFNKAVVDIQQLITDIDQRAGPLLDSARQTVDDIDRLVVDADGQLDRLGSQAQDALKSASAALNQLDRFLTLEHGEPARVAESFRRAADSVPPALGQTADAFGNIANMTGKDSPDRRLLDRTLKELSDAARSVRIWAEYLERHPEALITGKGGPKRR